jgi:hypothetical protein
MAPLLGDLSTSPLWRIATPGAGAIHSINGGQWLAPELVGPMDLEVARDEREDRPVVVSVSGAGETPSSPRVEVVLAHKPADLLGIHDNAAVAEFAPTRR